MIGPTSSVNNWRVSPFLDLKYQLSVGPKQADMPYRVQA